MPEQGDQKDGSSSIRVIRIGPRERTPQEQKIIDIS